MIYFGTPSPIEIVDDSDALFSVSRVVRAYTRVFRQPFETNSKPKYDNKSIGAIETEVDKVVVPNLSGTKFYFQVAIMALKIKANGMIFMNC